VATVSPAGALRARRFCSIAAFREGLGSAYAVCGWEVS
jgi:hypothetical protein